MLRLLSLLLCVFLEIFLRNSFLSMDLVLAGLGDARELSQAIFALPYMLPDRLAQLVGGSYP